GLFHPLCIDGYHAKVLRGLEYLDHIGEAAHERVPPEHQGWHQLAQAEGGDPHELGRSEDLCGLVLQAFVSGPALGLDLLTDALARVRDTRFNLSENGHGPPPVWCDCAMRPRPLGTRVPRGPRHW